MMTWQEDLSSAFTLSTSQISALEGLLKLLVGISDRNLTAVTGEEKIINVHFRDSLSLLAFSELGSASDVVDIGSGAGFPGLPLAIALPDKSFTLLESNAKRCKFLTSAAVQLQLDNVRILAMRAEVAGRSDLRDSSDLALARAVGPLPVVLEYSLPLLKPGGAALLQRGAREANDDAVGSTVAELLGGELNSVVPVYPYPGSRNLHVWLFSKKFPTPQRFPRKPGIAKKRPLCL